MSETNDFKKLIGPIKKIKGSAISPGFYSSKIAIAKEKKQFVDDFEYRKISQFNNQIGSEDQLLFRRDGVQNNVMKKLAKGGMKIDDNIDLHGMTVLESEVYVHNTIENLHLPRMGCIRIIHGKGYHSSNVTNLADNNKPKLKNFIAKYLSDHPRVLAYISCPQSQGGAGSVYVLLSSYLSSGGFNFEVQRTRI